MRFPFNRQELRPCSHHSRPPEPKPAHSTNFCEDVLCTGAVNSRWGVTGQREGRMLNKK